MRDCPATWKERWQICQVESGDFSAPLAGAIASNTRLGSCILNCGSLATVNGQLAPEQEGKTLLTGESRGEIRNSFAPGQEETAESLNQEVRGLDLTWGVDGWNLWEQEDDVPALTTEYADVVETATAEAPVSLSAVSIQGYYSAEDKSWCFATRRDMSRQSWRLHFPLPMGM